MGIATTLKKVIENITGDKNRRQENAQQKEADRLRLLEEARKKEEEAKKTEEDIKALNQTTLIQEDQITKLQKLLEGHAAHKQQIQNLLSGITPTQPTEKKEESTSVSAVETSQPATIPTPVIEDKKAVEAPATKQDDPKWTEKIQAENAAKNTEVAAKAA